MTKLLINEREIVVPGEELAEGMDFLPSHGTYRDKDKIVSRTDLIEHIYDENFDVNSNVLDVYVNFLRNKIDKGFKKKMIHTVRGAGYILKEKE